MCGKCTFSCSVEALEIVGRDVTEKELVQEVADDLVFYEESGGGVTFSGGEPLAQPDFLFACLNECRRRAIHTAVDTCGYAPTETFERMAKLANLWLYDIKLIDDYRHIQFTGVSNVLILENVARLAELGAQICLVIPLVADLNDDEDNIIGIAEFAQDLGIGDISILPYHDIGVGKYDIIGGSRPFNELRAPSEARILQIEKMFLSYGLHVKNASR